MALPTSLIDELTVSAGAAHLQRRATDATNADWRAALSHPKRTDKHGDTAQHSDKHLARELLHQFKGQLVDVQELLYANADHAVLVVFQALDAGGKDGTIGHVMSGLNPQGCEVTSFKAPSPTELRHDFLWRCAKALPERGRIGIFNRSYYEDVLVVRVHPAMLDAAGDSDSPDVWQSRYTSINDFESHLGRNGTTVVKFFLHVSRDEQRRRLLARLEDPAKRWKFSPDDLTERARFDDYQRVYDEALSATSTPNAPWYVIPADHKGVMRALVAGVLVHRLKELHLTMPTLDAQGETAVLTATARLRAETPTES